jgi:hypothetical protein
MTRAGEQKVCEVSTTIVAFHYYTYHTSETQRLRALMAEAQLESGQDYDDMQHDDTTLEYEDFGQQEDDDLRDVASGTTFSECFQTCVHPR